MYANFAHLQHSEFCRVRDEKAKFFSNSRQQIRSFNQKSDTKNSCTSELLVCKFQALAFSRRFDAAVSRRGLFTKSSSREVAK